MKQYYFWTILLFPFFLSAQDALDADQQNIIPNPSFELYAAPPIGWFYKGSHYTEVVKYWSAATIASPDVYGPRVRVPSHWAEKGFGEQMPHTGHSMSGITVYGCDEGKPHCREYIQIQLAEPLVIDQNYYIETWVSHLPRSLQANNIGFYFSENKIEELTDKELNVIPYAYAEEIIEVPNQKWSKIAGKFVADTEANYLIIGNFFPDSLTTTRAICEDNLKYSYYYIDDVFLKKLPPILPIPVKVDDLTKIQLEEGMIVQLQNIYFELAEWELLPRSFIELKKLLQIMRQNPEMIIEIRGHTDNLGTVEYNEQLSEKRAQSVVDYLKTKGIGEHRTRHKGFGSSQPIAPNDTPVGRQLNRRVEFLVIQK